MSFLDEFFINKHGIEECEGDYRDENDILICGKCGTPKECIKAYKGRKRKFRCRCKCDDIKDEEYRQQKAKEKFDDRVKRLRENGIPKGKLRKSTFANDNGGNPEITRLVKQFVEHWDEYKAKNIGVLFYGDTGRGKSFYAACIANALIDKGVSVYFTTLKNLVELKTANYGNNNIDLNKIDLLIIDDFGVENPSPTAYSIIDERYNSNKPLIVTTNLTPAQLKNPKTQEQKRIYERILEMCGGEPIRIDGGSKRGEVAKQKREIAKNIFNS